jgi:transcription elongation GreA/GreB family factor
MAGNQESVTTGSSVRVGSRVRIRDGNGGEQDIRIVGSDREMGLYSLSPRTPLARALLGGRAGDEIKVHVDAGTATFIIVAVEP